MHRQEEKSFPSTKKEMEEEGTALQKAGQIPITSLVHIHLDTKLNLVQHRGGHNHLRMCTLDLIICQSKLLLP